MCLVLLLLLFECLKDFLGHCFNQHFMSSSDMPTPFVHPCWKPGERVFPRL